MLLINQIFQIYSSFMNIEPSSLKKMNIESKGDLRVDYESLFGRFKDILQEADSLQVSEEINFDTIENTLDGIFEICSKEQELSKSDHKRFLLTYKNCQKLASNYFQAHPTQANTDTQKLDQLGFDDIIGLEVVKNEIRRLINFVKISKLRGQKESINMHSIFIGPPGTGKTTIARLYGKALAEIGILPKGHVVEVDRSDLVAGYVGQSAIKTLEKIKQSLGGILFIDEAYSLTPNENDGNNNYGSEVISTLLKKMEDLRNEFVVIVAGYSKEMKIFLNSNSGLKSRIPRIIEFESYRNEELMSILISFATKDDFKIRNVPIEPFFNFLNQLKETDTDHFGNAREIRNLFEEIKLVQADRLSSTTVDKDSLLDEILENDIIIAIDNIMKRRQI